MAQGSQGDGKCTHEAVPVNRCGASHCRVCEIVLNQDLAVCKKECLEEYVRGTCIDSVSLIRTD
jgi:hypothetical protein